ncbi:helix-turn-helix domain-containing protein [Comamonas sp. C11]|uniref:AraC-like ligand-binding domain-containing protein n=1 Tax=Comamonas sp. C11 TaxID=2966554 RepID=UPI002111AEB3|nr:helix-turn-helix domain-containing protein [Comamonas sp. C11]UUC96428.1 helix-turn-helix domain-containing protein [Comamonas sp. C11]
MKATWNTALIPQGQRAEFWRSAVCEAFLSMTPRIDCAPRFEARLDHQSIDDIDLNRVTAPAHGVSRTKGDIARSGKDVFFLNVSMSGRCHIRQNGREYTARAHELVLMDSTTPYSVDLPDGGEMFSLSVPSQCLLRLAPRAHDLAAKRLSVSTASRLLLSQIHEVAALDDITTGQTSMVRQMFLSLVAGCLSEEQDAEVAATARLRRLRRFLATHHSDPDYSPAMAANQAGISLRALHAEFERAGSAFSAELIEVRLTRARDLLLLKRAPLAVSVVSEMCGFKSAEHFSRRFRQRFGVSPSRFDAA